MFFILSKFCAFLLKPTGLIFIGLFLIWLNRHKKHVSKYIIATALLFYIFSNEFIINELYLSYETPSISRSVVSPHDIGIVLTGGLMNEEKEPIENLFLGSHADRFAQALLLYKDNKIHKILISGGDLKLISRPIKSEGKLAAEFLIKCGVNASDIILEDKSVNTYENAKFTAKILKQKYPNQQFLLISSASHLPRAIACFRKHSISVTPYGADYTSKKRRFMLVNFIPNIYAFENSQALVHEWIGFLSYKLMGYC
jgi:uncharacterized SAM-binding protein YcdF (DUF218 family)